MRNPGTARDVRVLPGATSQTCDVLIAEEGLTLHFMRGKNRVVRCIGRFKEEADASARASDAGFVAAVRLAAETMRKLDQTLAEREAAAASNVSILESSAAMCELHYLGWRIVYSIPVRTPLVWAMLEQRSATAPVRADLLTDHEMRCIKQRAFSAIQHQRKKEGYGKEGLGAPQHLGQLTFSLTG
jgi:hypothetical protein